MRTVLRCLIVCAGWGGFLIVIEPVGHHYLSWHGLFVRPTLAAFVVLSAYGLARDLKERVDQ